MEHKLLTTLHNVYSSPKDGRIWTKHTFVCSCFKTFKNLYELERHMKSTSEEKEGGQ